MVETADAIVIGAGIMGSSTAYHLKLREFGKVVVLERGAICSGSSALASGGMRHQYSSKVGIELSKVAFTYIDRYKEEFGSEIVFNRIGYLFLATLPEQRALYEQNVALQKSLGVEVYLLDADDVERQFPYVNTEDLHAATYTPNDGYTDPYIWTTGVANRAREIGVDFRVNHEVTGITRSGNGMNRVTTDRGEFEAPILVIAAGCWSGQVGKMIDVDIPVQPQVRQQYWTAPFPKEKLGVTPFTIDQSHSGSFHRRGEALLLGATPPGPPSFNAVVDMNGIPELMEKLVHRCPVIADAEIASGYAGLFEMTPDHNGIISAVTGHEGVYVMAGFSGHGFMHGTVAGKLLTELIMDGEFKTVDVSAMNLDRFAKGELLTEAMAPVIHEG
jgi:sarcosine oxidase subunit beta